MSPGKQASESEAAPPIAAGARLETMRRRVRLSRLAVWTVIAAGPVALAVAVASTPTTVEAATPAKSTSVRTVAASADPEGYAQVFVSAWLRSSADDATSAQARLAQSLAPDVELPEPAAGTGAQSTPQSVVAVRSAQHDDDAWSVTVAAQYADGSVRYYAVPVAIDGAGTSFTVTGAPGVVAGPARAEVPASPYGVSVPDGDLTSALKEFFAAYLTGTGEASRYLAPGINLPAVSPTPYTTATLQQISAVEQAAAEQVPGDGTKVHILAQMDAADAGGRWPLAYELTLRARSGRWEIAALESEEPGTAQAGGTR
ncbi:conjugal transfer protein [Streptomyces xylophagus]|uniref:conjugal transfer protein n=1 Tax=Streptomyces xylophagus TaxID=285514 RepID=UPI0005BD41A7|nr:conjugal transfer protein [Streptomyces xylophagus]